jgi:hypothetical protein
MTSKTSKKPSVPNVSSLLGHLSAKRDSGELPKTELQFVQSVPQPVPGSPESVDAGKQENEKTEEPKNDKSFSQKNTKTEERKNKKTGRPSAKDKDNIEYVRLGCNIPKTIRQKAGDALNYERFKTPDGTVIKTLDELVTLALAQLLKE